MTNENTSSNSKYKGDDAPRISQTITDNAAAGIAGLKELAMLDNGALARIEELEKFIFYRQFYFPGGTPKLKRSDDRYMLDDWDPRYIEEYITQAQQNGFHRHFLYFDGNDVKSISFDDAYTKLYFAFEDDHFKADSADEAYGLLSGLMYMDKLSHFMKEYSKNFGMTAKEFEKLANVYGRTVISRADTQLLRIIGQSKSDFINKDFGWYSQDMKYAFDVSQYAREWEEMQIKYNEYKNRIWELLQKTQNLNLCTNRTSGINIGNVNIQQAMDCAMKIEQNINVDGQTPPSNEPESTPQSNPLALGEGDTDESNDENNDEYEPQSSTPQVKPSSTTNINSTSNANNNADASNTENKNTNTNVSNNGNTSKIIGVVVAVIFIVGGIVGAVVYITYQKNKALVESINKSEERLNKV